MTFEQIKNSKAFAWTVCIHIVLLVLFLTLKYTLPAQAAEQDMVMEVNLGTSNDGSGNDQPEIPEDPAPPEAASNNAANTAAHEDNSKEVMTSSKDDAPTVVSKPKNSTKKPVAPKPETNKKATSNTNTTSTAKNNTQQKAKYTYAGATGKGGNSAANNRPGSSEGNGTGNGDKGTPGGSVGGKNYIGVSHTLKDRTIKYVNKESDGNEKGSVTVRVTVNRDGNVVNTVFKSGRSNLFDKAKKKTNTLKFNADANAPKEQFGNITFVFK